MCIKTLVQASCASAREVREVLHAAVKQVDGKKKSHGTVVRHVSLLCLQAHAGCSDPYTVYRIPLVTTVRGLVRYRHGTGARRYVDVDSTVRDPSFEP